MDENNLKTTIKHFDTFIQLCEDTKWMETIVEDDIVNAFKLSNFLESFCAKLSYTSTATAFEELLTQFWSRKQKETPHSLKYFENANDIILNVFLKNINIKPEFIFLAIDEYLKFCGKSRFETVLYNALEYGLKHRLLFNFLSNLEDSNCLLENFHLVLMGVWSKRIDCGDSENVLLILKDVICDPKYTNSFLKLLAVTDATTTDEAIVKSLVLENFLCAIHNYSQPLLKKLITLDHELIVKTCEKYTEFLSALFDLTIACAKNMLLEYVSIDHADYTYKWTVKEPGGPLGSEDFGMIVQLLKLLSKSKFVGFRVKNLIQDMKSKPCCTVWEDIELLLDL